MNHNELLSRVALTLIPHVGPVKAKSLIAYCGSAEAIFQEKKSLLLRIPEIGEVSASAILEADVMKRAEQELRFIADKDIRPLFFTDKDFPTRLRLCDDGPVMIYTKGRMNLNAGRVISIVGTRMASDYGKSFCESLLRELKPYDPLVVSGLAYGIDICAHRQALANKLQTVACVAHGLERIYPDVHTSTAHEMMYDGGLVTEYLSDTKMNPELFPERNRLIAGLADCTIVVETDTRGGSIITAHLASSYGREVFAVPGRYNDVQSSGCNQLIRKNVAAILNSAEELAYYMNWEIGEKVPVKQLPLFPELTDMESKVVDVLRRKGRTPIDALSLTSEQPVGRLSSMLLELEFRGIVKSLPGKMYELA